MLTRMTGRLNRVFDDEARVQIGPLEYQVLIPEFVRRQIQTQTGEELSFHLIEYIEGNMNSSRMIPRRIGFLTELELEFFELFCTVDKIGVKKALKAMGRPIREIADAIHRQDVKWLTTMPGIGKTTAEQIIATLRTKVTKFALGASPSPNSPDARPANAAIFEDVYSALLAVGLTPIDARNRIDVLVASGKEIATVEEAIALAFKKE